MVRGRADPSQQEVGPPLSEFNPVLHQATRLRIMVFLVNSRVAAVTTVRDALGLTDGNLAGHLQRLETEGYVTSRRALRRLRFEVEVAITAEGNAALVEYVRALRSMIAPVEEAPR